MLGACLVAVSVGHGDLTINYSFDGYDCLAAGVDAIDVIATSRESGVSRTATSTCSYDTRHMTLLDLPAGDYDVEVDGYDATGALIYDGHAIVSVVAGTVQQYDIIAPFSQGSLTINWIFEGSGACLDVYDLHVVLIDPFAYIYDDALYPCDYGGLTYDDLMAGSWHVTLHALDASGRLIYAAENRPVVVEAYSENEATIELHSAY